LVVACEVGGIDIALEQDLDSDVGKIVTGLTPMDLRDADLRFSPPVIA
jgi:hypothetical protein